MSTEPPHSPQTGAGSSPPGPPAQPRRQTMFENENEGDDCDHVGRDEANNSAQTAGPPLVNGFGTDSFGAGNHAAGNNGGGNGGGINGGGKHDAGDRDGGDGGAGDGDGNGQDQNQSGGQDADNGGGGSGGNPDDAAPPPNPNQIELRVVDNNNNVTHFRVKRTTKFAKVFQAYATKEGKDLRTLRFLYTGERVLPEKTPDDLEMEDQDSIEVMIEQIGGGYADFTAYVEQMGGGHVDLVTYKIAPLQPIELVESNVSLYRARLSDAQMLPDQITLSDVESLDEAQKKAIDAAIKHFGRYVNCRAFAESEPDYELPLPADSLTSYLSGDGDDKIPLPPKARESKL